MQEFLNTTSLKDSKEALFRLENGLEGTPEIFDNAKSENIHPNKEAMSVLGEDLQTYIGVRGPISVYDYMLQCSNHFVHGYYQTSLSKIGAQGDFVTAPEMSQLFGEMVGMWCLSQWMSLGKPERISLVEMGPGKGTLMQDILNVAIKFPRFHAALHVHMVELSDSMRSVQRAALGCPEPAPKTVKSNLKQTANAEEILQDGATPLQSRDGVPVSWHYALQQVPEDKEVPILAIGQEFLDAFPVHQFVYDGGGWKEKLVDVCRSAESNYHFRFVLSPTSTPATRALLGAVGDNSTSVGHREGDTLEISPIGLATCESLGARICRTGGAALFIDYGENYTQGDTLRGFRKHQLVSPLSMPGVTDITADVDFSACARAAAKRGAVALGAIPQGEFLIRMGVVDRAQQLIEANATSDDDALRLLKSLKRLVDVNDMGMRFKVLTFMDPRRELNTIGFPVPNRM